MLGEAEGNPPESHLLCHLELHLQSLNLLPEEKFRNWGKISRL